MTPQGAYLAAVDRVIQEVIEPAGAQTDASGAFPRAGIDALGRAGLLGLISSKDVGGQGEGLRAAALTVERIAQACASTAMVTCMHYAATAVIEAHGPRAIREQIAAGRHLSTLAFSESGSRGYFWAPLSTAQPQGDNVTLNASKSWVTSAGEADSYVWSSRPAAAEGFSTIWLVPAGTSGVAVSGTFDGLGLRGNSSRPISASNASIPSANRLGEDGKGFDIMMGIVLPYFQLMSAGVSIGIMEAAVTKAAAHLGQVRYEHMDQTAADQPVNRAYMARARIKTDQARALLGATLDAAESNAPETMLRVLEVKAAAGEAATEVTDLAMRVSGGAAFRKEVGVERHFRDARAATVMAPTTDVLHEFIGRIVVGLPLFCSLMAEVLLGAVAYDPKTVTIWEGFRAWFREAGLDMDFVLFSNYERQVEALLAEDIDVAWNSPLAWVRAQRLAAAAGKQARALAMRDTDRDLASVVIVRTDGPIREVDDLRGRTVAVGAIDSPQATLIPLFHIRAGGLKPGQDFTVRRFDIAVGKHGDHIGGEGEAARALARGEVDAACVMDATQLMLAREGIVKPGETRVLTSTPLYDHCNMTVVHQTPALEQFSSLLLEMSYEDAAVRPLLDLEGLKAWLPGRLDGYKTLEAAVDELGFYDAAGAIVERDYRP